MRWKGRQGSSNVEDRRASGPRRAASLGLGAILVAVVVIFLGGDPSKLLAVLGGAGAGGEQVPTQGEPVTAESDEQARFASVVLKDTEDVWNTLFQREGLQYREPVLVLFRDAVQSACGFQQAAVGPFYCPGDDQVYVDLGFFDELANRHDAPGDFAQAYVLAHEVGHHIQNVLGFSKAIHSWQQQVSEADSNQLSVRLELQADYLAGVWAHHAQRMNQILEEGDLEEALNAASAIGDDRLQKQARGYVAPDSFTHGTSAQRMAAFRKGLETGAFQVARLQDDLGLSR